MQLKHIARNCSRWSDNQSEKPTATPWEALTIRKSPQPSNPAPVTVSAPMAEPPERSDRVPQQSGPSDGQLVSRVLAGERACFDELVRRYQRQAVAVSYRLLGNSQDAMEVTQDAFLKGFTSLSTLQKPEAFGGWLMRIVSNLSLNFRRARKIRQQLPLDDMFGRQQADATESAGGGSERMS